MSCVFRAIRGIMRIMDTASDAPVGTWVPSTEQFGARLALVRQSQHWNIKEAALACGIPEASWRSWEKGAKPRDMVEVCHDIADRTGVDFYWLIAGPSGFEHRPISSDRASSAQNLKWLGENDDLAAALCAA